MTIGNDIKPRKVYYPRNHHSRSDSSDSEYFDNEKDSDRVQSEPVRKDEPTKDTETPRNSGNNGEKDLEAMQDSFFEDYSKPASAPAAPGSSRIIRIGPGKIIVLMVIIILAILVVQNFSSIKSFLFPQKNNAKNPAPAKVEQYTSDTQPTSSNGTAPTNTNENINTDTDSSANSNTAASTAPLAISNPTTTTATTPVASSIALKVLNGNGVSGTAASVADELRQAGFTVQSVSNAKSFSYSSTIIYYKTGKEAEANIVKSAIKSRATTIEQSDKATGSLDVVVVVGKS